MSYSSTVLADSPIRYYRLGEASGTVAVDSGSQAQNGTLNGGVTLSQAGLLVGDANTSMRFDGTSGYISLPTTGLPTGASVWSVEMWCKTGATIPGAEFLFFAGTDVANEAIELYLSSAHQFKADLDGTTGVFNSAIAATNTIYHVVATYNGTQGYLYVNGALVAGPVSITANVIASIATIGRYISTDYWLGNIQEVAVYSTALTLSQVTRHYIAGTTAGVSQPIPYSSRALGSTLVYESRTFIPRALGGVYLPDTVLWVPRALGSTIQSSLLRSLTLAGVGTLSGTLSVPGHLSLTIASSGKMTGIHDGFASGGIITSQTSAQFNTTVDSLIAKGAQWLRTKFSWWYIQDGSSTTWNWTVFDSAVAYCASAGINIVANLLEVPTWALPSGCVSNTTCPPNNISDFTTFVTAVVNRYKATIHHWEIWNEPNTGIFTVANYTSLLIATYAAIKAADPTAMVLTGGTAPAATSGGSYTPCDWLTGIYANDGSGSFDIVAHHPYCFNGPGTVFPFYASWSAWSQMADTPTNLRGIMEDNGDGAKPIWATEFGAPTSGGATAITEAQQAQLVLDAYALFHSHSWGGKLFWYEYQDIGTDTSTVENFFGIVRYDGSLKASFDAYTVLHLTTSMTVALAGVGTLAAASPTLATSLADTLSGVGTLSGALSLTAAPSVTIAGVGALSGTLSAHTALTDTLAGVGTIAGTLSLATALAGTLAGVGTLSGALSLNTALATTLTGVGTSACALSVQAALTSTLAGVGTLSGTISERTALSATLPGVGTLTAALSGAGALSVTIAGTGALSGTASLATALTATEAGAGTLSGALTAHTALSGTTSGTGTTSGAMAVATGLTAALAGMGTCAGTLAMQTALSVTEAAAGALAGALSLRVALFLTCAGAGTCAGTLVILGSLAATCAGMGTLAGAISFPGPSATATWKTRDLRATWVTRDDKTTWNTRR